MMTLKDEKGTRRIDGGTSAGVILVVEDDAATRTLAVRALEAAGFRAFGAADAIEAVHWARSYSPDLILSDLLLPGLDGATASATIRDEFGLDSVPIVLVSADPDLENRAREAGAADFIPKPFLPGALVRTVRRVLGLPERET